MTKTILISDASSGFGALTTRALRPTGLDDLLHPVA
jgi:NADP-dependent 3-hydroxy acid dehydrogenase YdfG